MHLLTLLLFLVGIGLLIGGAEILVRGAARLAEAAGISPLVVGLTVVAYGTSAPELAVTMRAMLPQPPRPDLALGNVVGSNISNVLLVLGLSATICPLLVSRQLVRYTVPLMITVCLLVLVLAWDGTISRVEGGMLFLGAIVYTATEVLVSRRSLRLARGPALSTAPALLSRRGLREGLVHLAMIVGGLLLLLLGASWLVEGASQFARWLGISELVVGLTVVAVGTSMPEIATSVVAALRGQRDIAVGNVVGSNIFNVLLVLGASCIAARDGMTVSTDAIRDDIPIMVLTACACLPVLYTGYVVARWEGILFLVFYVAYTGFLFLRSTDHPALPGFQQGMGFLVLPLTGVFLLVLAMRAWRYRQADSPQERQGSD